MTKQCNATISLSSSCPPQAASPYGDVHHSARTFGDGHEVTWTRIGGWKCSCISFDLGILARDCNHIKHARTH